MNTENKFREVFVTDDMDEVMGQDTIGGSNYTAGLAYIKKPDNDKTTKFIEYAAVEQLKVDNTNLKLDNDHLQLMKQNYLAEITKLREQVKDYEVALKDWLYFENESIKKDGPYVGEKINKIIMQVREVLKKWSGL